MDNPIDHIKKRQEAIKRDRDAGIGEVGIFWFFKGEILQDSIPFTHGEEYGDFVNGKSDHCSFWRNIQRIDPAAAMYEYDQVPRGRVVYSKRDDKFIVYGSEQFVRNDIQRHIVVASFNLPLEKTVFRADEHYSNIPGMIEDPFVPD